MYIFESRAGDGPSVRGSAAAALRAMNGGDHATPLGWFGDNPPKPLRPEDVALEMIGRPFRLTADVTGPQGVLPKGSVVTTFGWVNDQDAVLVRIGGSMASAPKTLLRPVPPATRGIVPYSAGVDGQARAVQRREKEVDDWTDRGKRANTTGTSLFKRELARLQGLLGNSRRALNQFLIQETMYNRFDPLIAQWVDFYNRQFGFTGANALDPNIVKSMMFRESHMGTSGPHMQVPPTHFVKTRFNLLQVVDSSGSALSILMKEMAPSIVSARHLTNLERDLATAQADFKRLKPLSRRNPAQQARFATLVGLGAPDWEGFIWRYRAPGESSGFSEALRDFFATGAAGAPPLNEDYAFWIRAGVRWLCEKRQSVASWDDAVKAYNGSGPRADAYRTAVLDRVDAAKQAATAGTAFIPKD